MTNALVLSLDFLYNLRASIINRIIVVLIVVRLVIKRLRLTADSRRKNRESRETFIRRLFTQLVYL